MARPKPFLPKVEAIIPEVASKEKDSIGLSRASLPPASPHAETAFCLTALRKADYNTPSLGSTLRAECTLYPPTAGLQVSLPREDGEVIPSTPQVY